MIRRAAALLGVAALVSLAVPDGLWAQVPPPPGKTVNVRDNFFEPVEVRVQPGDTVRWTAADSSSHTVTADDASFGFFPDRTLSKGETVEWTVPAGTPDSYLWYHCSLHGVVKEPGRRCGMCGAIVIGDPPPPPPPPPPPVRDVPTAQFPTIGSAFVEAEPGTVVRVAPGVYRESVVANQPRVTIRGAGSTPADVVIDGEGFTRGVRVLAEAVRLENLTVRGFGADGVLIAAPRFSAREVWSMDNDGAGFRLAGCRPCDASLDSVRGEANLAGVWAQNATSVVVQSSVFRANGAGIVLQSTTSPGEPPQSGSHLVSNLVEANNAPAGGGIPSGVGIWIAGGWLARVEANSVAGHDLYGIAVSWHVAPSRDVVVEGNTVTGSGQADLAWDGIGAGTCFSGNSGSGDGPTTEPPLASTLYACGTGLPVGVPVPTVTARLLLAAA